MPLYLKVIINIIQTRIPGVRRTVIFYFDAISMQGILLKDVLVRVLQRSRTNRPCPSIDI